MSNETSVAKIYTLLPQLMRKIGVIPKGHRNKEFRYRYRSIDDLQKALQPALCDLGLSVALWTRRHRVKQWSEEKARGGQRRIFHAAVILEVAINAPDGSAVTLAAAGEGLDYSGDKASSKAMVAAYKYAITLGLSIPVEDVVDSDRDGEEGGNGNQPSRPPAAPQNVASKPTEAPAAGASEQAPAKAQPEPLDTTQPKSPYSSGPDDPCLVTQQEEIIQLATSMKPAMTAHDLKAVVVKRGAQTLAQLTVSQAEEIIGRLKTRRLEQEAASVF